MSTWENRPRYLSLIEGFIGEQISASAFVDEFSALWKADRDQAWADPERGPVAQELLRAVTAAEISKDEFASRWRQLWWPERPDQEGWDDLLGRLFSACDGLEEDETARGPHEYGPDELRALVREAMKPFRAG